MVSLLCIAVGAHENKKMRDITFYDSSSFAAKFIIYFRLMSGRFEKPIRFIIIINKLDCAICMHRPAIPETLRS